MQTLGRSGWVVFILPIMNYLTEMRQEVHFSGKMQADGWSQFYQASRCKHKLLTPSDQNALPAFQFRYQSPHRQFLDEQTLLLSDNTPFQKAHPQKESL